MNPVLLKPQSETGAQVVVQGRVLGNYDARAYFKLRSKLMAYVLESYERVRREADLVFVEGAGSPAEVNLRENDLANMGFARAAGVPVVLVGDIERGGVIAALVGTHALLEEAERRHLKGYVINKFRGDPSLFEAAHGMIAAHTGMQSYGVVPWFEAASRLPAEDVLGLDERVRPRSEGAIRVAVPRLPRLSNFDDLDPLAAEPDVVLAIVPRGKPLPGDADLVILPGSKATLADLAALRAEGWDVDLKAHVRRGGAVLGICGGLQMLGRRIADPDGAEGRPGEAAGLGLLEVETVLGGDKRLGEVEGIEVSSGEKIQGYEMHIGRSAGPGLARPMLELAGRPDGAVSANGRITGCYVHGLFAADGFRHVFLARLRERAGSGVAYETEVEAALDALAEHLEASVDVAGLLQLARRGV
jgi:adenosylcobyric acid synthase